MNRNALVVESLKARTTVAPRGVWASCVAVIGVAFGVPIAGAKEPVR